jgi:hypothetical protein
MRAARDLAGMAAIFAALSVLGYPLVRRLRNLSNAELAAWSWIAGLLALAGAQAIVLLFGLRTAPWKLWTILAALALAFRDRAPRAPRTAVAPSRIATAAGILSLGGLILFSVNALSEPMWAWDYVAIWGLKGKMFYLSGGLPPRFFHDPELAFVHPSYPFLLPLLLASLSTLAGGWDSQALALLYPAFELATLVLTWGFLRRRCGPEAAAVGTVLTAGFFSLYQSLLVGLADIPMALGFVLAGSAFLDSLDAPGSARVRPLILSGLFCCSLKKEGAVFLLLLAAAAAWVWVRDRGRSSVTAAAIFAAVPALHQALLRAIRGAASDAAFRWSLIAQRGGAVFLQRLQETAVGLLHSVDLPALLAILGVALVLLATRRSLADPLLAPLGAMIVLYAVAPAASAWTDAARFADFTFARVTTALVPLLFLVLGARMSESLERFSLRFSRNPSTMN